MCSIFKTYVQHWALVLCPLLYRIEVGDFELLTSHLTLPLCLCLPAPNSHSHSTMSYLSRGTSCFPAWLSKLPVYLCLSDPSTVPWPQSGSENSLCNHRKQRLSCCHHINLIKAEWRLLPTLFDQKKKKKNHLQMLLSSRRLFKTQETAQGQHGSPGAELSVPWEDDSLDLTEWLWGLNERILVECDPGVCTQ